MLMTDLQSCTLYAVGNLQVLLSSCVHMYVHVRKKCLYNLTTVLFSFHCLTSASLDLIDPRTHPFVYHRLQTAMVSIDVYPITQCVRTYHTHVHSIYACFGICHVCVGVIHSETVSVSLNVAKRHKCLLQKAHPVSTQTLTQCIQSQ